MVLQYTHANANTGEKHRRELVRALHFDMAVDHDLFCCMPIRFRFRSAFLSCVFGKKSFFVWGVKQGRSSRSRRSRRLMEARSMQPVIPLSFHKRKEVACPICNFMQDLG